MLHYLDPWEMSVRSIEVIGPEGVRCNVQMCSESFTVQCFYQAMVMFGCFVSCVLYLFVVQ